jgi:PBP1b-binding outer membrane lipoprotein LpoB
MRYLASIALSAVLLSGCAARRPMVENFDSPSDEYEAGDGDTPTQAEIEQAVRDSIHAICERHPKAKECQNEGRE